MENKLDKNSDRPLYLQIKDRVKERLPDGETTDKIRIPSERQLAETYGVSRMTARQALKSLSEECPILRNEQGTFLRNDKREKLNVIRFVFPRNWSQFSLSAFYMNIFAGAEQKSHEHGCDLLFSTIDDDKYLIEKLQADDAIVLVAETDKNIIRSIHETGCHLCLVDSNNGSKNLGWDLVNIDNAQGSEIAADAFIKNNHVKCAYLAPYFKKPSFAFKIRHKAFSRHLAAHDIPFSDTDCFKMGWEDGDTVNLPILDQLIVGGYTAVYASHAHFAVDLMQLAKKHKRGEHISFIGFSDDALSQNANLNTIGVMETQIGETAIEQIIKSYNNGWCLKQSTQVPTYYIDRGSVHSIVQ
jgi:DNA-binding LacI/PurR family transcriptional regulator